jgi:hypothetical protein
MSEKRKNNSKTKANRRRDNGRALFSFPPVKYQAKTLMETEEPVSFPEGEPVPPAYPSSRAVNPKGQPDTMFSPEISFQIWKSMIQ